MHEREKNDEKCYAELVNLILPIKISIFIPNEIKIKIKPSCNKSSTKLGIF